MKLKFCLLTAIICMMLSSCGDDEIQPWLQGESQNFSINSNVRTEKLPALKANDVWTATVGYGTADTGWLTLDKDRGEAGTVELTAQIEANLTNKYRSATVTVECHGSTVRFQFSQAGTTGGDTPKPSASAKVAKIVMTSYNTNLNAIYEESLALEYTGSTITGASYHSIDREALTESNVSISIDRSVAGKRVFTLKETGMPDEVITAELDNAGRIITAGDNTLAYNTAGYLLKRTQGEKTWVYDTNISDNLLTVTSDSKLTFQFDPKLAMRQDCNIDLTRLAMMTMTQRGLLKYALLNESGAVGAQLPNVLFKAVGSDGTYTFNPQFDSAKTLLSIDLYHRYNTENPMIQKRYEVTYTD